MAAAMAALVFGGPILASFGVQSYVHSGQCLVQGFSLPPPHNIRKAFAPTLRAALQGAVESDQPVSTWRDVEL